MQEWLHPDPTIGLERIRVLAREDPNLLVLLVSKEPVRFAGIGFVVIRNAIESCHPDFFDDLGVDASEEVELIG